MATFRLFQNRHIYRVWMFALVVPGCWDARETRRMGLPGLRTGQRAECNRPLLIPRVVIDPIRVHDRTFRPLSAFNDRKLYGTKEMRRAIFAGNRAQKALLAEEMAARRARRAAGGSQRKVGGNPGDKQEA